MDTEELRPGREVWACEIGSWGPEPVRVMCEIEPYRVCVQRMTGEVCPVWSFECWPNQTAAIAGAKDRARIDLDLARDRHREAEANLEWAEALTVNVRIAGPDACDLLDLHIPPLDDPEASDVGRLPNISTDMTRREVRA